MIRLIEARNFRCLRNVCQPLDRYHVLVGPNASGKSSFMDVLRFLGTMVSDGLEAAITERTPNLFDLMWHREGERFELAIEAVLPEEELPPIDGLVADDYAIRYEVAVGVDEHGAARILEEQFLTTGEYRRVKREYRDEKSVFLVKSDDWRHHMMLDAKGDHSVHPEIVVPFTDSNGDSVDDYFFPYRPTGKRSVFQNLSVKEFPSAIWLFERLRHENVVPVELQSNELRKPSRPGQGNAFSASGTNLPWIISDLQETLPDRYHEWLAHLRQALPDIQSIRVVDRPEDRFRYLMLGFADGLEIPSWMLSEGTLRLLALTLLAYHPQKGAIYLVEEPETNIHPLNIEVVMQSLGSLYDGQVLVTTHSPTVLSVTKPEEILVFHLDKANGAQIVRGDAHPELRQWKGQPNLSILFASGVLG
jgi:predicted ATPase